MAVSDLNGIVKYISKILKEPTIAKRLYASIKKQIFSLEHMPYRCKLVNDEHFCKMGIRKLSVENYTAFYFLNEESKTVHIVRILYNRREWQHLL